MMMQRRPGRFGQLRGLGSAASAAQSTCLAERRPGARRRTSSLCSVSLPPWLPGRQQRQDRQPRALESGSSSKQIRPSLSILSVAVMGRKESSACAATTETSSQGARSKRTRRSPMSGGAPAPRETKYGMPSTSDCVNFRPPYSEGNSTTLLVASSVQGENFETWPNIRAGSRNLPSVAFSAQNSSEMGLGCLGPWLPWQRQLPAGTGCQPLL
mmetsp:Transcript_105606/g.308819  ORF Transcript_105606/g.308819 Transcript_105606/m.308819 type:complete len:213 (+) Transcript_105606:377-1015(+)